MGSMTAPIDQFNRPINYLRLSVTDRCDFRCTYCMSETMTFLPRSKVLSLEQLLVITKACIGLGINKIRITGGEPLIRKNIQWLIQKIGKVDGLKELCLTTNGSKLKEFAPHLADAGVKRLNISLDSLNPIKFRRLTRFGDLNKVLDGIEAAKLAGIENIKINTVVQKNVNATEVGDLTQYCLDQGLNISFIEEMPLGSIQSHSRHAEFISSAQLRERLSRSYQLLPSEQKSNGPSRYWHVSGYQSLIGFISPHSHNFCNSCNRIRVTVEGRLLLCLGNENSVDLKKLIEQYPGDFDLIQQTILNALSNKPEQHHFDLDAPPQILRFMNATGG